ncbi:hydroxysqualene dehydroxylase HpnE [Paenalcaligenes hominis]|uniref:hydroxysqualene dehydroxylase HpnE n=1 Tax=Paenalcaligenes hominis TaxID=643674 RepID=UPI003526AE39
MRIGIIGAGWAGAAAAWQLHKDGHEAVVFEAAHEIGGRARNHDSKRLGQVVDNGQHLLLGAYASTLALMQELGLNPDDHFYRFDLDIYSADQLFRFKTAPLPAPFHLLGPLFKAKGLAFKDRLALVKLYRYLGTHRWRVPQGQTVNTLLQQTQQPEVLVQKLWHPLCIAALNTPIEKACAQLFANVLRDSLGGPRAATQMLIPLRAMGNLWAKRALQHAQVHTGSIVRSIEITANSYAINGQHLDGVIVATNSPSCYQLLQKLDSGKQYIEFVESISAFCFNPIATLYLLPQYAWENPHPMLMLEEDLHGLEAGQWVFNHAALTGSDLGNVIAVTISYANRLQGHSKEAITAAIVQQIQQQSVFPLPPIVASELITEKRATFVAHPQLNRPTIHTPWPGLMLAGDWVQNPYPAVLEGAVQSGLAAARAFT